MEGIDSQRIAAQASRFRANVDDVRRLSGKTKRAAEIALSAQAGDLNAAATALAARLNTQHEWLFAHPEHTRFREFESRWLIDLAIYQAAIDALHSFSVTLEIAA